MIASSDRRCRKATSSDRRRDGSDQWSVTRDQDCPAFRGVEVRAAVMAVRHFRVCVKQDRCVSCGGENSPAVPSDP